MAEEVNIVINVEGDGKAQKTVKDVKKELEATGKAAKQVGQDLKVQLDVRQRLRDLQNRMAEIGDVGSLEFQRLAKEAGGLKDQMNNANAAINSGNTASCWSNISILNPLPIGCSLAIETLAWWSGLELVAIG